MHDEITIRILEKDVNRRGDLFGRLMADLFVALGYEQPRLNIHKSGRELDLSADHRLEPRRAIGECKATVDPIGGDDLNKFVGALDVEHEDKRPLTGYFISLAGFKETAIEQEKQRRRTKIVTLTGSQVVSELVKGRILISEEKATELAGRCCVGLPGPMLDPGTELLAHRRGWIWAIYYTQGKIRTHFALIHSDGTPLARALTDEVVASDRDCGGAIGQLVCLNPEPLPGSDTDPRVTQTLAAYGQYLANECGFIQLDGLPADSDVGSRRLRLENLFVPLHLDVTVRVGGKQMKNKRQPVGAAISGHPRLALLAAPGGGKSTLVKRLAVAYADSARREQIDDDLPSCDWLPLFFRCRELRGLARGSFAELLEALSQREPVRQHAAVFRAYVDRALLAGRVLLLVDGLDEISDPGDRAAFVCTVRTALQAYPGIATVVTSREAGFRHVAAHLAPVCTHAVVSPFNPDDISRLSVAWHREVVGDTEKIRADAEQLANAIVRNDRIKRLAVNPLLLTTLLLVKRWVGSLPTRRTVLYGKAVEVLLMTWNTEGHEPIPEDEALPQLCYVASAMMLAKVERISRPRLSLLLQEARAVLPSELGYVKGTVEEFINRVEDRSSLLMMTGNDVEDGRLAEFFEFRHLTFQEFLTARAIIEGWYPGRKENDTLVDMLRPHFEDDKWREVIPLAAVLAGRKAEGLMKRLAAVRERRAPREARQSGARRQGLRRDLLFQCIRDEVQITLPTLRIALRAMARNRRLQEGELEAGWAGAILQGRFGVVFQEVAEHAYLTGGSSFEEYCDAMTELAVHLRFGGERPGMTDEAEVSLRESLERGNRAEKIRAALVCMWLAYSGAPGTPKPDNTLLRNRFQRLCGGLVTMLDVNDMPSALAASWALAWLGEHRLLARPPEPSMLLNLYGIWRSGASREQTRFAAWALSAQELLPRDSFRKDAWGDCDEFLQQTMKDEEFSWRRIDHCALVVSWYRRSPWKDFQIAAQIAKHLKDYSGEMNPTVRELLEGLDETGRSVIADWERKQLGQRTERGG